MEHAAVTPSSVTDFFYDDPTMLQVPLPEHDLDEPMSSHHIYKAGILLLQVASCRKKRHLDSIEHHIKYKHLAAHKSELLKLSKLTHN